MKSARRPEVYPGTQAVLRAVAVLKAFTADRPERGLADLARAVGLNKTTAHRLLATRWPAHATSTGKTILAFLSPEERNLALPRVLPQVTPRTLADRTALDRELARVRERGFALSQEQLEPGFVAVGAPVYAADGRVTAAISVGGPKVRLTPETIASIARRLPVAAARISERLGSAPPSVPRIAAAPPTRKARG